LKKSRMLPRPPLPAPLAPLNPPCPASACSRAISSALISLRLRFWHGVAPVALGVAPPSVAPVVASPRFGELHLATLRSPVLAKLTALANASLPLASPSSLRRVIPPRPSPPSSSSFSRRLFPAASPSSRTTPCAECSCPRSDPASPAGLWRSGPPCRVSESTGHVSSCASARAHDAKCPPGAAEASS
jgi:hypothetical protein